MNGWRDPNSPKARRPVRSGHEGRLPSHTESIMPDKSETSLLPILDLSDSAVARYLLELICDDLRTDQSARVRDLSAEEAAGLAMYLKDWTDGRSAEIPPLVALAEDRQAA